LLNHPPPPGGAFKGTGAEALDYDTGIFQSGFSKQESYEMIKAEDFDSQIKP
jgi:hypothetical protein